MRLGAQAERAKLFASVRCWNLKSIRRQYPAFWRSHERFIMANRRGLGYWLWKPFLISNRLQEIEDGALLIYADAGCEISIGKQVDWFHALPTEPDCDLTITCLEPHRTVGRWTNNYCLKQFDGGCKYVARPQYQAGLLFMKNGQRSRELVRLWLEACVWNHYSCLVDRPDDQERDDFNEHRHDQAILTLLLYSALDQGRISIKRLSLEDAAKVNFPIHIYRNGTPFSLAKGNTLARRISLKIYYTLIRMLAICSILSGRQHNRLP